MDAWTIVIAAATAVTAFATCVSAFVSWTAWRGRLAVEWEWHWATEKGQRTLEVRPTIVNGTSTTVQAGRVSFDKSLVKNVLAGNPPQAKHESWPHMRRR